ncbi:integrin alpha [Nannocystis sp. SCPEA4]|uniref:integrin alpha n=1 Tax=Nannocystis sp. SCPEA4 TaxID=2996787 RepID=UPI00226F8D72|nr:integrin alpha [Nannocystis sp. SCPEA4]MCY1060403.1 integrin alpha [Nannocystis sp. SCPEA4]
MTIRIQRAFACVAAIASISWSPTGRADNRGPDFDNDNLDDLAVSVYADTIGGVSQAGVVHLLYGTNTGLDDKTGRITTLWRGEPGVEEDPGEDEAFGRSLAWGDFDGDCFDDLTVVVGGDLQVFYGSSTGLSVADDEVFSGLGGGAQAAGDFNGDGFDDLAVQTFPDEVSVWYGSATGLDLLAGPGLQIWDYDALGVEEAPESEGFFGHSLASGDFNCDGVDDLAIGSPFEHLDPLAFEGEGVVYVLHGTPADGLVAKASQVWHQDQPGVDDDAEVTDAFGWSLATGNFNNDSENGHACQDLAIGVPGEIVDAPGFDQGAVQVLYGGLNSGLQVSSPTDDFWTQGLGNIEGTPTDYAAFGRSVVAGKMDGDEFEDLAIGASGFGNGGAVEIIRGGSGGLVDTDDVLWSQASTNVPDSDNAGDNFGWCLAYGREWHTSFDRGLAVCVPNKDVAGAPADVGSLAVLYLNGVSSPAVSSSSVSWNQSGFGQTLGFEEHFAEVTLTARDRPITTLECD